ncbi:MAG: hypothetical protein R2932_16275 [Caldilineaceae bacterium]
MATFRSNFAVTQDHKVDTTPAMEDGHEGSGATSIPLSPSQRMLTVTEEELSRIILDIHDGPVQYLFTALSLLTGIQQEIGGDLLRPDLARAWPKWACCLNPRFTRSNFLWAPFVHPNFDDAPSSRLLRAW